MTEQNLSRRTVLGGAVLGAAAVAAVPAGASLTPAALLAPIGFAAEGTNLVETDNGVTPPRKSVIAANVTDFSLTAPEVVDGLPLLTVEMTLGADGNTITRTRTIRIGAQPRVGTLP